MRSLKFHFCHPVKGTINLLNRISPGLNRMLTLDTRDGDVAEIPVEGLAEGKWLASLAWEYDGAEYFYEREFEVTR